MPTPTRLIDHIRCILCIGFALLFSIATGQPPYWKIQHLGTEHGLSNRFVNCITQDNRGFAWIGTNFGLNRFDGHRVDILTKESNKLHSNTIHQLKVDFSQNIWVILLCKRYDGSEETF